ncbi:sesB-related regulatory protein [Aspergillus nomiae NRRL 13137]|uniref:SesB-related regulatory protein n=1 Tax=Aspergillus nomiae NRRL (strain ATCC 15546 / NRRL 13137 / CBS 260.88 / M93) TaxID=1509407 RepID=A0A0L1JCV5_ASPN3|nr:sesB-related regulatory protein [Aspergillus nomiae NRRL 13137]KNG89609.1 sesB-related regulatory protein [Aspergillus nomiae NRRL 13137]
MALGVTTTKQILHRLRLRAKGQGSTSKRQPRKTFPAGLKLLCGPNDATIDIVFVHGLTGDRDATWTAPGEGEPWPKTLLPAKLPTARILTFGYDAYVADWRGVVSQSVIANHAWNLLASLSTYRDNDATNERPIIFVCHSLGGLVCEDALFTSKQRPEPHLHGIIQSTRGIIFLGTPHHGAGLARWAEIVSRSIGLVKQTNPDIVNVLKRDSEVLARIQEGFHTMVRSVEPPPIKVTCFYEELPVLGIGFVVPQDSAVLPGYVPIGIHSNHMDMTKFSGVDDPGFVAICGELRRWIKDISATKNCREARDSSSPAGQAGLARQYGDNNQQYIQFAEGTQNIVGGNQYQAQGDMNFGMVPPK